MLALREVDRRIGLSDRLGRCFRDFRNPNSVEHPVRDLAAQRVHAQALGYEDLNDHDPLCREPLLALALGRQDALGGRVRSRDRGRPLAASSTLNRLELGTPEGAAIDRYKRIAADPRAMDDLMVDLFLESEPSPPDEVWLDLDATDDPVHGRQEGRFTGTTVPTVTCRCTSSAESICCARDCGRRTAMPRMAAVRKWPGFGPAGPAPE